MPRDSDVVAIVKRYASDESVSQSPTLALPQIFLDRLPTTLPEQERPLNPLSATRRRGWLEMARLLNHTPHFENRGRAVEYLIQAADGSSVACCNQEPLPWHAREQEASIVRLEDVNDSAYRHIFPVQRFRATLRR